ncbi:alpha/beta hydrolase [Polaribacter sp.]|uniref:alpha/beta hydrolase n=1 Tax=Polaribacter sp. TaxID=1920175 RepID=UPI003EF8A116
MTRILLFIFLVTISVTQAQSNDVVFELKDNANTYNSENCLTNDLAENSVYLGFLKGDETKLKGVKINVSLDDQEEFSYASFSDFNATPIMSVLFEKDAFQNFKQLSFSIEIVLLNDTTTTQNFTVCLKDTLAEPMIEEASSFFSDGTKEYIEIPVSFATDRKDTKNTNLNERFSGQRAEIQYGRTVVSIPYTHQLGQIEKPSYWRFEFSEDPNKHMMLQSLEKQNKEEFFEKMKQRIAENEKSTFLFVHGYNVSFEDAAKRTAQITYDLRFNGEPVFYSWPSQGSTTGYTVDEANIEWSRYNMKNFLRDYLTKTEAEHIYLVAHSMGNRGLTKALIELMNEQPALKDKITEVILAAPDIDADVFKRDIAPQMVTKISKPITLYVSSDDLALLASKKVHGNYRAGDADKGIVIVKGIETIDASGSDTSFLNHSYFATTSTIIGDIFDLIKSGKRATDRETLEKVSQENLIYWKIKKGKD